MHFWQIKFLTVKCGTRRCVFTRYRVDRMQANDYVGVIYGHPTMSLTRLIEFISEPWLWLCLAVSYENRTNTDRRSITQSSEHEKKMTEWKKNPLRQANMHRLLVAQQPPSTTHTQKRCSGSADGSLQVNCLSAVAIITHLLMQKWKYYNILWLTASACLSRSATATLLLCCALSASHRYSAIHFALMNNCRTRK